MSDVSLRVLGTCTATPEAHQDCTCFLLDHSIMIDTGFSGVVDLLNCGEDPLGVDYVFITHCHHDHYMGLPQLLFYHRMRGRMKKRERQLVIVGPKPEIRMVVGLARQFLRCDVFDDVCDEPSVVQLDAGAVFETERFTVQTCPTLHPVTGLCYRFTDKKSGRSVVFTGDTGHYDGLGRFAAGADLLVHEASWGACSHDATKGSGHSGSVDAATVAAQGKVGRLALVHYAPSLREKVLAAAQDVFPATVAPLPGEVLPLGG